MSHAALILAVLGDEPAPVATITARAVELGLDTTDKSGTRHRVRTVLQALRTRGLAESTAYGYWARTERAA